MKLILSEMTYFPRWGAGVFRVWRRNFLFFRYTLFISVGWIFLEPLMLLAAFGYGLGQFVTEVNGQPYANFIAPAMIAATGMFVAFFEGTYGTYTKLKTQNTLETILIAPVSSDEVALAEIAWATSKAMISVLAVSVVTALLGLIDVAHIWVPLLMSVVFCWGMAAFSVMLASVSKSYDWFIYFQSGFAMPMSLFCGTYFPKDQMPEALQYLIYCFPLTHIVVLFRSLLVENYHPDLLLNISYLLIFAILFTNMACSKLKKKLIL